MKTAGLRAALRVAAKDDIRHYLNGVCLQFADELYVLGTDGRILFASRQPLQASPDWEPPASSEIIIPREAVKNALRFGPVGTIGLERIGDGRYLIGDAAFKPLDGHFPKWAKLRFESVSGEVAQFAPRLYKRAAKAIDDWSGESPTVYHNGSAGAMVQGKGDDAFCVLMPWRNDEPKAAALGFKPPTMAEPAP